MFAHRHVVQGVLLNDDNVGLLELVVELVDFLGIVPPVQILIVIKLSGEVDGSEF